MLSSKLIGLYATWTNQLVSSCLMLWISLVYIKVPSACAIWSFMTGLGMYVTHIEIWCIHGWRFESGPATSTQFPVPLNVFKDILTDLLKTHSQATTDPWLFTPSFLSKSYCMHAWGRSAKRRPKKRGWNVQIFNSRVNPKRAGRENNVSRYICNPAASPWGGGGSSDILYDFIITLRPALGVSRLLGINVAPVMRPHPWGLMVLWRGMMDGWRRWLRDTPCTADVL